MKNSGIVIRLERKEEHREVENLIRESFWNVYRPGCYEHYLIHTLRNDPAFVPELDFVEVAGLLFGKGSRRELTLLSFCAKSLSPDT
ncbi:MAG: hypothetical protein IJP91_04065 [Synergistaceae bacterium]|nr:hypothetical protein [Synergistaceae bacterium]